MLGPGGAMKSGVQRIYNVREARDGAFQRLPRVLFDYVDGGADDEVTLRANRAAFEAVTFLMLPTTLGGNPSPARSFVCSRTDDHCRVETADSKLVHPALSFPENGSSTCWARVVLPAVSKGSNVR